MTTLVAVMRRPADLQIVGVWVTEAGSTPVSYSDEPDPYWSTLGDRTMAQKGPAPSWADWFDQLARRTPLLAWWEVEHGQPGETPQQVLERLRAEQQARRAASS